MGRGGTWGPGGTRERTSEGNWKKPLRWNRLALEGRLPDGSENEDGHRPRIFCASLADVFEPRPELEPWRRELLALIEATPELDWLLLTKRPEEARDFLRRWYVEERPLEMRDAAGTLWEHAPSRGEWTSRDDLGWGVLPNLWMGVSIENSRFTWRADVLREIPAAVRFISAEPLLGSLFEPPSGIRLANPRAQILGGRLDGLDLDVASADISIAARDGEPGTRPEAASTDGGEEAGPGTRGRAPLDLSGIDWIIAGGESGGPKSRPPHPSWIREIRDAVTLCDHPFAVGSDPCPSCSPPDSAEHSTGIVNNYSRPALFVKQWGSWSPAGIGDVLNTRLAVGLLENGRQVTVAEAAETPGGAVMVYRGPKPTAGGKHFAGSAWCEFPQREMMLA